VAEPFAVSVTARGYEIDANGHVAGAVLLQYSQHARWACLRAAGVDQDRLLASGLGPVSLEERIRFHAEVRAGETPRCFVQIRLGRREDVPRRAGAP
jgi:acyl-CoA thioester hydrolase